MSKTIELFVFKEVQKSYNFVFSIKLFVFKEWQKVREILTPDGPDEEFEKREKLKQISQDLQRGWHDNKKVKSYF